MGVLFYALYSVSSRLVSFSGVFFFLFISALGNGIVEVLVSFLIYRARAGGEFALHGRCRGGGAVGLLVGILVVDALIFFSLNFCGLAGRQVKEFFGVEE